MYIVLLSGGSGKRLWPLSNDLCSKQYIKLMNPDEAEHSESTEKCSMLQRVFGQLKAASLSENTIVCASDSQVELIESQLDGQAEVAVEPMRRNTFPAVMLSCAYLLSNKGAKPAPECCVKFIADLCAGICCKADVVQAYGSDDHLRIVLPENIETDTLLF